MKSLLFFALLCFVNITNAQNYMAGGQLGKENVIYGNKLILLQSTGNDGRTNWL